MSAGHNHAHHHHDHAPKLDHLNRAFIWGIGLNIAFVAIEAAAGFITGSLALLTDAGHNLSDVASLALALLAFKLTKVSSNAVYTYGYKRSTILVSFFNAVILFAAIGFIVYEAIERIITRPEAVPGSTIIIVALIGIGINAFTAWLFMKDKEKDLNVKGAYLHMAVDALVSLGVVISGIIIYYTGWYWLDSAISLGIAIVILMGTWGLFKDSLRLEMDGVPKAIDLENIRTELVKADGVMDVHHIHVWALSTTENALTAHVVLATGAIASFDNIKHDLRHRLQHLDITHCTFEPEFAGAQCPSPGC